VSMFNESHMFSLPGQSSLPTIWMSCVAHTANLALADFWRSQEKANYATSEESSLHSLTTLAPLSAIFGGYKKSVGSLLGISPIVLWSIGRRWLDFWKRTEKQRRWPPWTVSILPAWMKSWLSSHDSASVWKGILFHILTCFSCYRS
jgi:hypothetical protein